MYNSRINRTVMTEVSPLVKSWRADVMTAAFRAIETHNQLTPWEPWSPINTACQARMVFSFNRPKSVPRHRRPFMSIDPDVSKLARSTEDALQAAGVLKDDNLIVDYLRLAKVYCSEDPEALPVPGAIVILVPLLDSVAVGDTPGC
jgi:Holliday junction resolvase RusA-like endonuclease